MTNLQIAFKFHCSPYTVDAGGTQVHPVIYNEAEFQRLWTQYWEEHEVEDWAK